MRKEKLSLLVILTVIFAAFTLGFLTGRNQGHHMISVNISQKMLTEPTQSPVAETTADVRPTRILFPININTADEATLRELPGIGEELAQRILIYRDKHGSFSSVDELLNVKGIGQKRLDEIWNLITIGG